MNENEMRILKKGSCPSLSGRSELSYHIGCDDNRQPYIQISSNTGKGLYLKSPIPFSQILPPDDKPFSSGTYQALFKGRSVNTAGFIIAILKHLNLVQNVQGSSRSYIRCDSSAFNAEMQTLMDADSPADQKSPAVKIRKKVN